ncbi:MAG: aspartate kinase [Acidimicrobiia bacterium]|nr:aspartate kinase [Acidimicrobiia bacterium]
MALIVQKFGGTSVGDPDRIKRVARRIADTSRAGNEVIVVVSAMGKSTDDLIALAADITPDPPAREMDMLLTAGERISMALVAMALHAEGVEAVSLTGSQAGILTDNEHGSAKITEIRGDRIRNSLDEGKVVIVAGFQGVSPDTKEVTTLGRGGSDATAVALAAAHHAEVCEIYTDVDGVFTADPRVVPTARKLDEISFDEMLELASSGAGVLMARSVEVGRRFNIPIHVRSSFHTDPGTWVKETTMEQAIVSGVAHDTSQAKVTVAGVPDTPGVAARLFEAMSGGGVNVDMIVQNVSRAGHTDISFTVPRIQAQQAGRLAEAVGAELGSGPIDLNESIAKVSLIGAGMKSESGIAARVFRALADKSINIDMISTSSIRISCVVPEADVNNAVGTLVSLFNLEEVAEEVGA